MGMIPKIFQNNREYLGEIFSDGKRMDAKGNKVEEGPQITSFNKCYIRKY